ncbi:hypothetical protein [Spirosoma sp.]|uniref:hypothetical protein n=1 Tax=Spirosoma sp. TaxID=1899569 RepID=UPI0026310313|nr:hypothetical protein [Spirosoma sp.]MCX6216470.1 hypothetical protein [Spirosoma sp.]
MTLFDASLLVMRLFTLMGFIVFLAGFILIYLLAAAVLISFVSKLGFRYDYRKKHPNLFRSCIFQTEAGEWKSTPRSWVCNFMPDYLHHWSHWIAVN